MKEEKQGTRWRQLFERWCETGETICVLSVGIMPTSGVIETVHADYIEMRVTIFNNDMRPVRWSFMYIPFVAIVGAEISRQAQEIVE